MITTYEEDWLPLGKPSWELGDFINYVDRKGKDDPTLRDKRVACIFLLLSRRKVHDGMLKAATRYTLLAKKLLKV